MITFSSLYVYQLYSSMKLHFNDEKYDMIKYGVNTTTFTEETFETRKDKAIFEKVYNQFKSKETPIQDLKDCLATLFLYNSKAWIGDIAEDEDKAKHLILKRKGYRASYSNSFKRDVDSLFAALEISSAGTFGDYLSSAEVRNGLTHYRFPRLITMVSQAKLQPESAIIFDLIFHYIKNADTTLATNPVWKGISLRFKRFRYIMNISDVEFKSIRNYVFAKIEQARV